MKLLRAYLLVRRGVGDWHVSVHHDLESLREAWRQFESTGVGAVVHVGFWRPETGAFEPIVSRWPALVFLTGAARYALPQPCHVAPFLAGVVDDVPMYIVLEGWGYSVDVGQLQIHEQHAPQGDVDSSRLAMLDVSDREDWVTVLGRSDRELAQAAIACGVVDEGSYQAVEGRLHIDLRRRLGLHRYVYYSRSRLDAASILDNLRFAPPWLLSLPVAVLDLSVRATNRMREHSIETIADLATYREEELLKFDHLGRKSVYEIAKKVAGLFADGPASPMTRYHLKDSDWAGGASQTGGASAPTVVSAGTGRSGGDVRADRIDVEATENTEEAGVARSLGEALSMSLGQLSDQGAMIMRLRMGYDAPPRTLQQIGDKFGVTRERIRQVESKCVTKMARSPTWKVDLESRLDRLLRDRADPLPLHGLSVLDSWFSGAEDLELTLEYLLHRLCGERFSFVRVRTEVFVSRLSQTGWEQAVQDSRRILDAEAGRNLKESDARALIDSLLVGVGEELRSVLWTEATRWAHFAAAEPGSDRVLVSFGYGAENIVEAVLAESDRPLHYTEIARRCAGRLGRVIDVRRAHSSAANVGLLFGRGTYGLMKHFPLSEAERRLLVAEAEDLVAGNDHTRQWHAREIAEELEERGLDFGGKVDQYVVSIALEQSRTLAYLGRMVWGIRSAGAQSSANRIDVRQAVVSLLIQEGRPMHSDEIRDRISRDRGLGGYFQIQPEGPLLRMAPGLWGLVNRDLPFAQAELESVLSGLVDVLRAKGRGLHVSELRDALEPVAPQVSKVSDPEMLLGLAQQSGRIAVGRGQYAYLPEWGDSRRLTALDSVRAAFDGAPPEGLTTEEGVDAASRLLERPVSKAAFRSMCADVGAVFDEMSGRWRTLAPEEDVGDELADHDAR